MSTLNDEILREALAHLDGWQGDQHGIHRTLEINDAEHAELTERIKVVADAMRLHPTLRRTDGCTDIDVDPIDGESLSTAQVALAARIEAAYRAVCGTSSSAAQPVQPAVRPWMRWRRHRDSGPFPEQAG